MTKSKILWLTLAGWSLFFLIVIACTQHYYANETATARAMGWNVARAAGLDPSGKINAAAFGIWLMLFLFIWFIGALPLFIAAVVTRKEKQLSNKKER